MAKKDTQYVEPRTVLNCPFCGANSELHCEGSYVRGWTAFVQCSRQFECGAKGPTKRTNGLSNEEYVVSDQVIEAWNSISRTITKIKIRNSIF